MESLPLPGHSRGGKLAVADLTGIRAFSRGLLEGFEDERRTDPGRSCGWEKREDREDREDGAESNKNPRRLSDTHVVQPNALPEEKQV
jgi:hypothetical protein